MKEKNHSTKLPKGINLKSSLSGFVQNLLIFLLAVIIIFLSYSIFLKIKGKQLLENEFGNKNKAASIVQLEVLNGCGVEGAAETFTDFLRKNNFDVVQTGNYRSFDIDESIVIDRTGNEANAVKVADALGIDHKNIIQQVNNDYILDVSLVIGKDFKQLKPDKQ